MTISSGRGVSQRPSSPTATGQLTVAPGTGGAAAATLAYSPGHVTNETVIAPVDANGKITIVTSTAQDFVIDVSGYFTPPTSTNLWSCQGLVDT